MLITGASIVDGTGLRPPFLANIAIENGMVTAIGQEVIASGPRLDATGMVVTPGFIDPHTHIEPRLLEGHTQAGDLLLQGITTVMTAADGFGWAPLPIGMARELWSANHAINGPMPGGLVTRSIDGYLRVMDRGPVNVIPLAPGGAIRFAVMGWDDRAPGAPERRRMTALLVDWLERGAAGLGIGLDYEPGRRAREPELVDLAATVAARGGVLAAHMRYEESGRAAAVAELGRIADRSGVRLSLAHERLDQVGMAALDALPSSVDVTMDFYGYNASSSQLDLLLPASELIGGPRRLRQRLRNQRYRARLARLLDERVAEELASGTRIAVAAAHEPAWEGRWLEDVAREGRTTLGELGIRLFGEDATPLVIFRHHGRLDHDSVERATWADPRTMVASDGVYTRGRMHPRGYGTFARVLSVAHRAKSSLSLEGAVHRMTWRTANRYGVPQRGQVAVGWVADLVILDPLRIEDRASWNEPSLTPAGIEHVLVAGHHVVNRGTVADQRAGRVLAATPR